MEEREGKIEVGKEEKKEGGYRSSFIHSFICSYIDGGLVPGSNVGAPWCCDPIEDWPGFSSLSQLTKSCSVTMFLLRSHSALGQRPCPLA